MRQIKLFADRRLVGVCPYCSGRGETRDHVPPKVFLDEPYPENLPVVLACLACNQTSSLDGEYAACLIEAAACGSTDPTKLQRAAVTRTFEKKPKLRALVQERLERGAVVGDARVERVLRKIARGLRSFEVSDSSAAGALGLVYAPLGDLNAEVRGRFFAIEEPELRTA